MSINKNAFDVLQERGFIKQTSHEKEIKEMLQNESVTFYIGFDPTADSLHIGHYVPMMALAHMQKAGHKPIVLLGGGTTTIGDPSGKTDMRKMMDRAQIDHNADCFKTQMSKFIDFDFNNQENNINNKAIMVNNADWLLKLNYIDFLRDVGAHFSVNRMLGADCYKQRLEKGLTFMEFNYMVMQSYDFLHLNNQYNAKLQLGGDDQWSNILAGADLIRRKKSQDAFAMTFALLTTSEGKKMGKTEKGAVWLDENKTSPFEFYQYWRNIGDADVKKCLCVLTFIEIEEINKLCDVSGSEINNTKKVLAYELTKQIHGEEKAKKAQEAAESLFGGNKSSQEIPEVKISAQDFELDKRLVNILVLTSQAKSKGDARRLIEGGGIFIDNIKITDPNQELTLEELANNIIIQKGKKSFVRVIIA